LKTSLNQNLILRKIFPYFLFAKGFLLFALILSLLSFLIFSLNGLKSLSLLFWFKIFTSFLGIFIHSNFKAKETFFYMNIGIGKKELILFSLFLDFIFWFVGIFILIKI